MPRLSATILSDNTAAPPLVGEWGLSICITLASGRKLLLDAGAGPRFLSNAKAIGLSLADADAAILSHAHFDHAGGMEAFLQENPTAPLYLRAGSDERCYSRHGLLQVYIGIRRGFLKKYESRIVPVDGVFDLGDGIFLEATPLEGQAALGREAGMYRRRGLRFTSDDFSHEQFLVAELDNGIVVFSCCSHCGADRILNTAMANHPGKPLLGLVGGLHLFRKSEEEVRAFAKELAAYEIGQVTVGHCTGEKAYAILREALGDRLSPLEVGKVIEF